MDYYQKYLKYKNKYLILRRRLYGGDLTEEQIIKCFDDERFKEVGRGIEGIVYKDTKKGPDENFLAYKVIPKRSDIKKGVWGKTTNIAQETFLKSVKNYESASTNGLGPKFYGWYSTDKHNIIVMEFIEGQTLEKISEKDKDLYFQLKKRQADMIQTLKILKIIPPDITDDTHNGNFIYRQSDNKLFAIDL
jgi:serine/threonine protein kinase